MNPSLSKKGNQQNDDGIYDDRGEKHSTFMLSMEILIRQNAGNWTMRFEQQINRLECSGGVRVFRFEAGVSQGMTHWLS